MLMNVSRRTFLAGLGAGAAAAAAGPASLFGLGQEPIILGAGNHRYEWVRGWAKLPEGKTFAPTHGCVQVDSKDRIFVNTDNDDAVMIFEKNGAFVKSWGKGIAGRSAHGMSIVKEGDREFAYIAHTGHHKVFKATLDGEVVMTIPWPEAAGVYKAEANYQPTMVAIAPGGDIYVAAGYGQPNNHITQFDKGGKYVRSWNGSDAPKPLNNIHGVWIDTRGKSPLVLGVDRGNGRLVHFTLDGKFVAVIAEGLPAPCKAYIQGGDVLLPNLRGGCTILDKDNKVVAYIGENKDAKLRGNFNVDPKDFKDGEFTAPHGACWDSEGNMYVEDWNKSGRVTKLRRVR